MNKVKTIKIKNEDGSISEESYSIAADALNIDMINGKNVQETIGTIDIDKDGNIAEQLKNIKNNLVGLYKKYESIYITTIKNELIIPIEINQYDTNCILEVYIEGRILNSNEYKVNDGNSITLTKPLSEVGTMVQFIIYKFTQIDSQDYDILKGDKGDSGAIVFNTIAEMKADKDLVVGNACQLLTNDGEAELYKIINDDFSEYADDYNYVEIVKNDLYAVRIEQKRDKKIRMLQHEKKGMWGISRNNFDNTHYLIYSDNGINWNYVGNPITKLTSDSSAVCEINGIFYYIGNGFYHYSTDLINWSDAITVLSNPNFQRVWGTSFYYDKNSNKIYAYSSFQYSLETITTPSGGNSYKFKLVVQEGTQNADGTITFGNASDLYYIDNESFIDPYVINDSIWGYLIAFKDEKASTVSIYTMNSPTSINTLQTTIKGIGIEAPQLLTNGQGNIFCYIDDYNLYPQAITGVSTLPRTQGIVRLSTKEKIVESPVALQQIIYSPLTFRHMGVALCSDKVYYLLKQIGISCAPGMQQRQINWEGKKELREITANGTYTVVNHPNIIYQIGSNTPSQKVTVTLNLKSVFENEPFKLLLNNCEIVWTGDIPSWWTYSQHFINNNTIFNYKELPLLQGGVTRPIINI